MNLLGEIIRQRVLDRKYTLAALVDIAGISHVTARRARAAVIGLDDSFEIVARIARALDLRLADLADAALGKQPNPWDEP